LVRKQFAITQEKYEATEINEPEINERHTENVGLWSDLIPLKVTVVV